jgi:hypothetical protein
MLTGTGSTFVAEAPGVTTSTPTVESGTVEECKGGVCSC